MTKFRLGRGVVFLMGLVLSLVWVVLFLNQPKILRYVDLKIFDVINSSYKSPPPSGIPVVIDLDEKSLALFGQWPWPRYRIAALMEKLKSLGVASVAMDVVFAEADRTSLNTLRESLLREMGQQLDISAVRDDLRDNDLILAKALQHGPYTLGYEFLFKERAYKSPPARLYPLKVVMIASDEARRAPAAFYQAKDVVANLPQFSAAVRYSGFFNMTPDLDGVLRRVPLIMSFQGKLYPGLSLAALMQATGLGQVIVKRADGGVVQLKAGNTVIPLDKRGNIMVRYRGSHRTFPYISAADVLNDKAPEGALQGKVALVGTSAMGLLELRTTPNDPVFPGVEVHATILDNILQGDMLSPLPYAEDLQTVLIIAVGIISALLLSSAGALWNVLALGACGLGLWFGSTWSLLEYRYYVSPLYPLLTLTANFSILVLLRFMLEQRLANRRTQAMVRAQDLAMQCLASLAETRDSETGGHIQRTQEYVKLLCDRLRQRPDYKKYFAGYTATWLVKSAPLHDIGKVGVPDNILIKPGKLTDQEFEEMKLHTVYGFEAINNAEKRAGGKGSNKFLTIAKEMAHCHHERWDGQGYPQGLKGEEIPLAGRIMAVADVYDALISNRVYREGLSHEDACQIIVDGRGTQFDPVMVDAFVQLGEEFQKVAARHPESTGETCPACPQPQGENGDWG